MQSDLKSSPSFALLYETFSFTLTAC